jgi:large subunit ribosomal protein L10
MKTKVEKGEELKKAKALLDKSQALVFADFSKVTAEDVRKLRIELKKSGANFLVIKKRLLGLLLKERGINADLNQFKLSVGTIFSEGSIDEAAGPAYKFFSGMPVVEGGAKDMWIKHLLSGYDMKSAALIDSAQIVYIGKLPPREVLLAQLLGMLTAPIRSFMYVLDQKAKQGGGGVVAASEPAATSEAASEPAAVASEEAAAGDSPSNDTSADSGNPEQKVEHAST